MQSLQELAPGGREAAALRRDADERGRRARSASASSTVRDDREAVVASPPRAASRGSRRPRSRPVADHPARGLAVVRVVRVALGEDAAAYARATPSPGAVEGRWTPSTNSTPGHGSSASSRLPSRSTWSQRLAICAPGGDPEARLDHAAEHHAEPERARGVRHPHRLADPARLRELDVDAVRPLGAGGDVGERVAVLVDVDRDRRAALQLGAVRVAGGQRLLAVLDRHLRQVARAPRRASSTR